MYISITRYCRNSSHYFLTKDQADREKKIIITGKNFHRDTLSKTGAGRVGVKRKGEEEEGEKVMGSWPLTQT